MPKQFEGWSNYRIERGTRDHYWKDGRTLCGHLLAGEPESPIGVIVPCGVCKEVLEHLSALTQRNPQNLPLRDS